MNLQLTPLPDNPTEDDFIKLDEELNKLKAFAREKVKQLKSDFENSVEDLNAPFKELSFGEKLVGITFNPAQDAKVAKVEALFAELADIVNESVEESVEHGTLTRLRSFFAENALSLVLNAQMAVVKLITYKD